MSDFWFWTSVALWACGGLGIYGCEARLRGGKQSLGLFIGTLVCWFPMTIASTVTGIVRGLQQVFQKEKA